MGDLAMAATDVFSSFAAPAAESAAPAFETGVATIGQGVGEGFGTGLEAFTGTGEGLFGSTTGLLGTAAPTGQALGDVGPLLGTGSATAMGSAADFLGAPSASAFNPSAVTPQAFGSTSAVGPASASLPPSVANANASMAPGSSVFNTGTNPITGVSSTGAPSAVTPSSSSVSAISAPPGVTAPTDPTSAITGSATSAATPAATPSSSIESLLGKMSPGNLATSAVDSLTKNPLGIGLGALGLGYNIMEGQKQTSNQKALTADANQATANSNQMVQSGEALQTYLTNGTLPPAYQAQVTQAIQDAKTTAISNAAAQGLPTDPAQNTALAATLAKIDASGPQMQAQVAQQLFSSGSSLINSGQSAANLSGNLYQTLVQNDTAQAANMGKAIATLAASLSGKSSNSMGNVTISTG